MNNMNITVKGAVAIAMDYLKSLDELLPANKLRLEETIKQDNGHWLITLSYQRPDSFDNRDYKIMEIDPQTKEVLAMRIRKPEFSGIDGGVF